MLARRSPMKTQFNGPFELMVTRNSSVNRFEVTIEGHLAKVDYRMSGKRMIITHTEVPDTLRGKGIAEQLVTFAVEYARKEGLEVVAECEYANRFFNGDQRTAKSNPSTPIDRPPLLCNHLHRDNK
jgi:uncharacterized protein